MFFATVGAMCVLKQKLDPQGIFSPGRIAFGLTRFSRL